MPGQPTLDALFAVLTSTPLLKVTIAPPFLSLFFLLLEGHSISQPFGVNRGIEIGDRK